MSSKHLRRAQKKKKCVEKDKTCKSRSKWKRFFFCLRSLGRRWMRWILDASDCRTVDSICYLLFACLYAIHFSSVFFIRLFCSHGNILMLMRRIAFSTEAVRNNGKVLSIRSYIREKYMCVLCRLQQLVIVAKRAAVAVVAALRLMMRKWNGSNNIPIHAPLHCQRQAEAKTEWKKWNHKRNKSYARERNDAGALISVMVTVEAVVASVAAVDKLARMSITMHVCESRSRAFKCMKSMLDFSRNHTIVDGDNHTLAAAQSFPVEEYMYSYMYIFDDLNVNGVWFGAWDLPLHFHWCTAPIWKT